VDYRVLMIAMGVSVAMCAIPVASRTMTRLESAEVASRGA
jgi:hypothetical protein